MNQTFEITYMDYNGALRKTTFIGDLYNISTVILPDTAFGIDSIVKIEKIAPIEN